MKSRSPGWRCSTHTTSLGFVGVRRFAASLLAVSLLLAGAALAQTPPAVEAPLPERSFADAYARATAEKKPILLMILNDAEPACQRMLDKVYGDPDVIAKLAGFVLLVSSPDTHANEPLLRGSETLAGCEKYPGLLCSEHQAIEHEMRPKFADATGTVLVPQHAVLRGDGTLLMRRPYAMKSCRRW